VGYTPVILAVGEAESPRVQGQPGLHIKSLKKLIKGGREEGKREGKEGRKKGSVRLGGSCL
jgi:hypothetical protein